MEPMVVGFVFTKVKLFRRVVAMSEYILSQVPFFRQEPIQIHAHAAITQHQAVMGVKEPSPLFLIPRFDIIKCFVPEYMHSVCLCVTKQFVNLWCDARNSDLPFYIKPKDEEMKKIKPPNEVRRNQIGNTERHHNGERFFCFTLQFS